MTDHVTNKPAAPDVSAPADPTRVERPGGRTGMPADARRSLERRIEDPAKAPGGSNTPSGALDTGPDAQGRGMGSNQ